MGREPGRLRSLYICYLSLDDPLVHTQVVAYLRGLAAQGHVIHLLTFETRRVRPARRRELRGVLLAQGIHWHSLRYHKRPTLLATGFDTIAGGLYAWMLVWRHDLDALHARSHVPAAMTSLTRLFTRRARALIFDIRGLMAEEYEDAGRWTRDGVPFRLTKAVERWGIERADGIVVLTERIRRALFDDARAEEVYVIPCCADLEALSAGRAERDRIRAELQVTDATVMVYVGKFGGWYMAKEMVEFFGVARRSTPGLHFLILTQSERQEIEYQLGQGGFRDGDFTIASVPPERLPGYLAASDFGISFIRPSPSKASSSPTKIGEYLGAGLPVVCTSGIGDLDSLITPEVGTLVSEHTECSYRVAGDAVASLIARAETRERCRALARRELSLTEIGIPRYCQLYESVSARRYQP